MILPGRIEEIYKAPKHYRTGIQRHATPAFGLLIIVVHPTSMTIDVVPSRSVFTVQDLINTLRYA